jgi:acetyl-CoA carboxylase carboxyl transferase subunit alpha
LENAYYSVISPEGCAAILWKDRANAAQAAAALKLTAKDLLELDVVDEVLPEPLGGAHRDYDEMAATLKKSLLKNLDKLWDVKISDLLDARYKKYRKMGVFTRVEPRKRARLRKITAPASPAPSAP